MPTMQKLGEHKGVWCTLEELKAGKAYLVEENVYRRVKWLNDLKEDCILQIKDKYYNVFLCDNNNHRFYIERVFEIGD